MPPEWLPIYIHCARIRRMNWDLVGHEWAVKLIKAQIEHDEIRHAYLITGPNGTGRRTLALRLAQALNCEQPLSPGEPCRSCRICRQTENMQHADLFVVRAEEKGGVLKVDQIRDLQHSLALQPYEARYRFALLLQFEQAHVSAMNAILKTLEEPPKSVILLLTADSPDNLLPTIVSRCETLRLRPASLDTLTTALQTQAHLSAENSRLLAHISGGRVGFALRLAREPGILADRTEILEDLFGLLSASIVERFAYVNRMYKDKEKVRGIVVTWLSFWRDVVLEAARSSVPIDNLDQQAVVEQAASNLDIHAAARFVGALERTLELLERNVNPRLICEVLILDLPHIRIQDHPS